MSIEQLGPYQILRKIGRGGMGTVYEGINVETDQRVAIKLLAVGMAHQAGFRERFEAEIEALRKLHHPNIVRLFGFGEQDGHAFYAMEFVPGSSLEQQMLRGRQFSWREVTQIGIETCRALRHAHDRGIIHRDIKPANLLLTDDGHIRLSDFGIARLFGNVHLTGTGNVLGTAEYMAPEQAEGKRVDPRADLYSLGGVMYVLLAHRPLFLGKSFVEMIEKQRFERPEALRLHAPEIPIELEQIIHQLLEKDPERRIPNATLLARRLETMQQAMTVRGSSAPGPDAASPQATHLDESAEPSESVEQDDKFSVAGRIVPTGSEPGDLSPAQNVIPPTRVATKDDEVHADVVPGAITPRQPFPAKATAAVAVAGQAGAADEAEPTGRSRRFVTVTPGDLDEPAGPPAAAAWISPQTWILLGALVFTGLLAWYLLQPPTADALYGRISAQTESGDNASLLQAEDDIRAFLLRFPQDPRCEHLREQSQEIELTRLERDLERHAKGLASRGDLLPIERMYLEAVKYAQLDPELGMAHFQAMIDLFSSPKTRSGTTWQCLELARRRLAQLREQSGGQSAEHLTILKERLARADACRKTDPARAAAMYRAVLTLYEDKPWAADAVRRARAALAETGR